MKKKTCRKCGVKKELESFYKHPDASDGYLNKCIACIKSDRENDPAKRSRIKNAEKIKARDRNRPNHKDRLEKNKAYQMTDAGKASASKAKKKWAENNKYKRLAQDRLKQAVDSGKIIRGKCTVCNSDNKIEGHHPDYSKPLEVIWLCDEHHKKLHKDEREKARENEKRN